MTSSTVGGLRKHRKVYLHKEILRRAGKRPRSVHHTIGDHEDARVRCRQLRNLQS
ncbi:hypothetical protein [Bradyrhizobium sp. 187]|uniref:hypothetical protein n=1 Tax=Bradyrhizobium sp. 187 TaxID=2782655 RepID=UPI001FFEEE4F|nr:hypothetical protein [Bradyrhizobium sp. 187]UPJ71895.1 hypothetical protein IVB19_30585 [Bradyrhizobium sp. 187]